MQNGDKTTSTNLIDSLIELGYKYWWMPDNRDIV